MAALGQWRFPTANVIVGDQQGNIGYSTIGALPLRSSLAPENGAAAQDGSASKFDWQSDHPSRSCPPGDQSETRVSVQRQPSAGGRVLSHPSWREYGVHGGQHAVLADTAIVCHGKESMTEQQLLEMFRDSTNPARQVRSVRIGFHLRDNLKQRLRDEAEAALKTLGNLA